MRAACLALGVLFALLAAGCGGNEAASTTTSTTTTTTPTTTTAPTQTTSLRVYFLRNDQVWPVARQVQQTEAVATAALNALFQGPTARESTGLNLTTAVPDGTAVDKLDIANGVATVELSDELTTEPTAQLVYTLTQFPTVRSVSFQGKTIKRADFEVQTPPILAESPLSFGVESSPLRVRGTANTFEATFQYELRGPDGKIVSKHFEMATSGSGTRGTFDFTVPYTIDRDGRGKLVLYEDSAEDGSRIHVQEIPLELRR